MLNRLVETAPSGWRLPGMAVVAVAAGVSVLRWGSIAVGIVAVLATGVVLALARPRVQAWGLAAFLAIRPALEAFRDIDLGGGVNAAGVVSTGVVAWATAAVLLTAARHRGPMAWTGAPWFALVAWASLGSIVAGSLRTSLPDALRLLQHAAVFFLVGRLLHTTRGFEETALRAISIGFFAGLAVSAHILEVEVPLALAGSARVGGVFAHPNALAFLTLTAMVAMLALWVSGRTKRTRWFAGGAMAVAAFILVATGTRAAWVAGGALLVLLLPTLGGRGVFAAGFAYGAVAALGSLIEVRTRGVRSLRPEVSSWAFRLEMWSAGWRALEDVPTTGVGLANYPAFIGRYYVPLQAHNDYLRLAVETGLFGLTLAVGQGVLLLGRLGHLYAKGDPGRRPFVLAGIASLLVLSIGALSDNVITQGIVMTNVAAVVGLGCAQDGFSTRVTRGRSS